MDHRGDPGDPQGGPRTLWEVREPLEVIRWTLEEGRVTLGEVRRTLGEVRDGSGTLG